MKSTAHHLWLFASLILFLAVGCQHSTETIQDVKPRFAIDLQTNFQHDSVRVQVNDKVVFNDTVTTLHPGIVDFACRITPVVEAGSHRIAVSLTNLGTQADTTLSVQDTMVVGVILNRRTTCLSFNVCYYWPEYD